MVRLTILILMVSPIRADDPIAATVNGEAIRLADVDAMLKRLKPAGPLSDSQTRTLREAVLEEIIGERLLQHYLAKHAPAVDAKEIDQQMAVLAEAQKQRGRTLAQFCRETGFREAQLRASFETASRWQKLIESRTTDAEYRAFFTANRDLFEGTTVRLAHILVRVGPNAAEPEVNAARQTLKVLKGELEARRISFKEAVAKHSLCPSARRGGDLGTIHRKDGLVEEPLAAAAFALKPFALSEPVRTAAGLHLVTITERKPGTPLAFEACVDAVKESYAEDARERLVASWRRQADVRILLP